MYILTFMKNIYILGLIYIKKIAARENKQKHPCVTSPVNS